MVNISTNHEFEYIICTKSELLIYDKNRQKVTGPKKHCRKYGMIINRPHQRWFCHIFFIHYDENLVAPLIIPFSSFDTLRMSGNMAKFIRKTLMVSLSNHDIRIFRGPLVCIGMIDVVYNYRECLFDRLICLE